MATTNITWIRSGFFTDLLNNHLIDYPTPINISYWWGFGSLSGMCLAIQLITGIFLAMHYTPHIDLAFSSVEHICRDVNNGWLFRFIHANGASFFFMCLYAHMFRGLYYGSYIAPRDHLWMSGIVIFILTMGTAFLGYVLPWGQMSFWAATVITNLASAIPIMGTTIVEWLWGGFSVDNATLNRFFSLHYLLPFVITGLVFVHLTLLHQVGSSNPLGVDAMNNKIPFYPYFYVKDLFGFLIMLFLFSITIFFYPNAMGHPDNYIPANPMVTPAHIVPEWYFLPFYAILRSIPDKLFGVIAMGLSLVVLIALPYVNTSRIRSALFRPIYRKVFWFMVIDCLVLGWIGQKIVEYPYVEIGRLATVIYFLYFIVIIPILGKIESV